MKDEEKKQKYIKVKEGRGNQEGWKNRINVRKVKRFTGDYR